MIMAIFEINLWPWIIDDPPSPTRGAPIATASSVRSRCASLCTLRVSSNVTAEPEAKCLAEPLRHGALVQLGGWGPLGDKLVDELVNTMVKHG